MTQQASKPASDELIPLCIEGSSFIVTYQTLARSPYFKEMIENDRDSILYVNDNEIFLDRSGRLFAHVLQYLRTDDFQVDDESTLRELLVESEDYELPDMFRKVMDKLALTGQKEYSLLDWDALKKSFNLSSGHGGKLKEPFGSTCNFISALKFEKHYIFKCSKAHCTVCTCSQRIPYSNRLNENVMYLVSKNKD